jgi:eukaryotic-like serine/threonine-protein kinase
MSLCINPNCKKPSNDDNSLYCRSCGSELFLIKRYRVTRLLSAKGGFSNTYEVVENDTIKVLKVLLNDHPHAIELFEQEAKVLSQLQHQGIPKGEGSFIYIPRNSKTPLHCLVMEKIEGVDLEEYLKQRNFQPIEQKLALEWIFQLTGILKEVHSQNFFHRDIKPSNIILKPNGKLVLIDFGAARKVTQTILTGGQNTQIYTSGYAPPEQEKGYAIQQSDFFALGRTFVFLLTGKDPKEKEIYDYYNNELNWRKYAPHIGHQLADLIDELMAEKANQRPANTLAIYQRLKEIVQALLTPQKTSEAIQLNQITPVKTSLVQPPVVENSPQYAGFLLRLKAFAIDRAIITVSAAILSGGLSWYCQSQGFYTKLNLVSSLTPQELVEYSSLWTVLGTTVLGLFFTVIKFISFFSDPNRFLQETQEILNLAALMLGIGFQWFYFVVLESSWLRTTPGKKIVGIRVTDEKGERISLKRANQRYWSKILSMLPFYLGFIMTNLNPKRQALHDKVAKTFIVKNQ